MGMCYSNLNNRDSAMQCYLKAIELDDGENDNGILFYIYSKLSLLTSLNKEYNKSLEYSMLNLKYATTDSEKAEAYNHLAGAYNNLEKLPESITSANKCIETCRLILKKRKLKLYEADDYIYSFLYKGWSLEELNRKEDAIDAYTDGKKALENYKDEHFYQDYLNLFNNGLARCYKALTNY